MLLLILGMVIFLAVHLIPTFEDCFIILNLLVFRAD